MIIIGNGILITQDEENPYFENAGVAVKEDHVVEIGDYDTLCKKYPEAEMIDVQGKIIMPGWQNNHEHIYSAFARGCELPKVPAHKFLEVLKEIWWKLDENLGLEYTYYSAIMTYIECIQNGVTFVNDHHASNKEIKGSLNQIAKAAEELGMRTCLSYEISDRNGKEKRNQAIEENMEFLQMVKSKNSSMLGGMIGLHASFTIKDETFDICKQENTFDAGYHIHLAEGPYDQDHCYSNYGISVVERLRRKNILSEKMVAAHAIHISKAEREILKSKEVMLVYNPESNMANGVGAPKIIEMLEENMLVGLGTDGYTHNMLESLKVAHILQKHEKRHVEKGFAEANLMLMKNNPNITQNIMGIATGIIKPEAKADIIVVDYKPGTPMNKDNYLSHIMFGMFGYMTELTMVNGKILMKDRKLIIADEIELKRQCQESAQKLWQDLAN